MTNRKWQIANIGFSGLYVPQPPAGQAYPSSNLGYLLRLLVIKFEPRSLSDLPRSGLTTQPGVLTPGTHPTRRVALRGRKVKFVITSEYGLVSHATRSWGMDLGQDKRTILFDVIASYALSGRSLNGVIPGVKTPG